MTTSAEFLDRGILPFTGRINELRRLMDFWRHTLQSLELRAALLLGEAGIGKSRLIEELIPRIEQEGGVVIHTRLYPESTTAITPLITHSLHTSEGARRLLRQEIEANIMGVTAALRRLARLRPTLMVIEDVHLMTGESIRDLTLLLNSVAEEPLSLLCSARPVELPVRSVLSRYLTEEIEVSALSEGELGGLWKNIFGKAITSDFLGQLQQITLGNPLALRSALRTVVRGNEVGRGKESRMTEPTPSELTRVLRQNVELLTEGMVAHLEPLQKETAVALASLGEIFSREAARALLDEADEVIDNLATEGIIATTGAAASPLAGYWGDIPKKHSPASEYPLLGFTHTLLHRHLAAQEDSSSLNALITAIADNRPLYSVRPFQMLAERAARVHVDPVVLLRALQRFCAIAVDLNRTPDWKLGHQVWEYGWKLFEKYKDRWSVEQARLVEVFLVNARLILMVREMHTEEANKTAKRLMELTEDPLPESLAQYRLAALLHQLIVSFQKVRKHDEDNWKSAEELVKRYPSLLFTPKYIDYLRITAMTATLVGDKQVNQLVERRYHEVIGRDDCPDATREWLLKSVAPLFLMFFESYEAMQERVAMLHQLEQVVDSADNYARLLKATFYYTIGEVDKGLNACDESLPRFIELGLRANRFQALLYRFSLLASRGLGLRELFAQSDALFVGTTEPQLSQMRVEVGKSFVELGVCCNDLNWIRQVIAEFLPDEDFWNEERIILAITDGTLNEALTQVIESEESEELDSAISALAQLINGKEDVDGTLLQAIIEQSLRSKIFKRRHPLVKRAIIELIRAAGNNPANAKLVAALQPAIHDALVMSLDWYAERRMYPFMRPLPELYGEYFSKKELTTWQSRIEAIEHALKVQRERAAGDNRLRVSMLGTITTQHTGEEPQKLRGARQRALLGLLVADRMLESPLDQREFRRLATGSEDDSESKRKVMNMGVLRLREAIGDEAVLTDSETPQLNLDYVQVDLLEAVRLLRDAREAYREGALLRAWPALLRALDITHGEVVFPTLYDDFFEAVREDFEYELRSTIIDIARALLSEGDAATAEQILRRGFDAMPEDEELSELLCQALESAGKRTAAERVRMQMVSV